MLHELTLTIPTDWALPAILLTGAALCATACALWRGGYAAGLADGRHAHLLHLEEDEQDIRTALDIAEKRLDGILQKPAPQLLVETSAATISESFAETLREVGYHPIARRAFAPRRVRETVLTEPAPRFPSPGSYYAAPMEGALWGRFRALQGGHSLQSWHTSQADAESGTNPVSPTNLPFGAPSPC